MWQVVSPSRLFEYVPSREMSVCCLVVDVLVTSAAQPIEMRSCPFLQAD